MAFTLIYWAVPNCNVSLKHAAIGGALASFLFELGKEIFSAATTFFPSYQLIYGAFAAVPLFLLWIYVSWAVILFAAEVVYLQGTENLDQSERSEEDALLLGLQILSRLYSQQLKGDGISFKAMQDEFQTFNKSSLLSTLQILIDHKLILKKKNTRAGRHAHSVEYYLIRDLGQYSLFQYLEHYSIQDWQKILMTTSGQHYGVDYQALISDLTSRHQLLEQGLNTPICEYFKVSK